MAPETKTKEKACSGTSGRTGEGTSVESGEWGETGGRGQKAKGASGEAGVDWWGGGTRKGFTDRARKVDHVQP